MILKVNLIKPLTFALAISTVTMANTTASAQGQEKGKSDPATAAQNLKVAKQKYDSVLTAAHVNISPQIPRNFPVPPYTSNIVSTSFINSTKGSPTATVGISTKDSPESVFQWYQTQLRASGWTLTVASPKLTAKLGKEGQFFMLDGAKEKQGIKLFCMLDQVSKGTKINITWLKNR
ncbi:MAG: hypothetical protein C0508_03420 [Cyanobacteria bacterium PR.023]|nr:hypothetical protein [Cyanobacteria bacterium PR.023]